MIPGPPTIICCPHCGGDKPILSLLSGNTFDSEYWSDGKASVPMFPQASPIQRCPHCGKYYMLSDAKRLPHAECRDRMELGDTGTLSFRELKEAWLQMRDGSPDVVVFAPLLVQAYNDATRFGEMAPLLARNCNLSLERTEEDRLLVLDAVERLIFRDYTARPSSRLCLAEWLRNLGEFDRALRMWKASSRPSDAPGARIYDRLPVLCAARDSSPYSLGGQGSRDCAILF